VCGVGAFALVNRLRLDWKLLSINGVNLGSFSLPESRDSNMEVPFLRKSMIVLIERRIRKSMGSLVG
jgi:hypothetical protein